MVMRWYRNNGLTIVLKIDADNREPGDRIVEIVLKESV